MAEAIILLVVAIVVSSAFMVMVVADGVHRHKMMLLARVTTIVESLTRAFEGMNVAAMQASVEMGKFAAAFSWTKDSDGPRVL